MFCLYCCYFVFFKQKTAYEMRISDWSSDVCSSDLAAKARPCPAGSAAAPRYRAARPPPHGRERPFPARRHRPPSAADDRRAPLPAGRERGCPSCNRSPAHGRPSPAAGPPYPPPRRRSEEHTSELQSLMRISYAVICLKTKNTTTHINTTTSNM